MTNAPGYVVLQQTILIGILFTLMSFKHFKDTYYIIIVVLKTFYDLCLNYSFFLTLFFCYRLFKIYI